MGGCCLCIGVLSCLFCDGLYGTKLAKGPEGHAAGLQVAVDYGKHQKRVQKRADDSWIRASDVQLQPNMQPASKLEIHSAIELPGAAPPGARQGMI